MTRKHSVVTVLYLLPCSSLRTVCYFLFLVLYCIWCHSDVIHVHVILYMACSSGNMWLSMCTELKFVVHIAPACRSMNKGPVRPPHPPRQCKSSGKHHKAHQIHSKETTTEGDSSSDEYFLHKLGENSTPIRVSLVANGKPLEMEVDTGADISIISEETRKVLFPT